MDIFYRLQEIGGTWAVYTPTGNYIAGGLTTEESATAIRVLNNWLGAK